MPHRDPETGRFVGDSRAGPGTKGGEDRPVPLRYNQEAQVQHISQRVSFNQDDPPGGNDLDSWTFQHDFDPVREGGLDRGEYAELLGFRWSESIYLNLSDSTFQSQTSPGTWEVAYGLGVGTDGFVSENDDGQTEQLVEESSQNAVTGISQFGTKDESPDILLQDRVAREVSFQEPVNGTGGAGHAADVQHVVNYLDMFDEGPVLDRFDRLRLFNAVNAILVSDRSRCQTNVTLYWNTWEVEQEKGPIGGLTS